MGEIFSIVIAAILTDNVVLNQSIGICPFLGVSKKTSSAVGMGLAVTLVIAIASVVCWILYEFVLAPLAIEYLQTIIFILIIACLVQILDIVLKKFAPTLYNSLGIYLALITTNCAVLGVTLLNVERNYNLIESMWYAFSAAMGFTLAIVLFAGVRERLETADIPKALKGFPIALITAGLIAMAFLGFQGLAF